MIKFSRKVKKMIKTAKTIAVFTHTRPDCDALGSSLALKQGLIKIGKSVICFTKDELTENEKLIFDDFEFSRQDCDFSKFDLCISVDAPSYGKLGAYAEGFSKHPNTIVFDHHKDNDIPTKCKFDDMSYSSCCEIVMDLLEFLKIKISPKMASLLYSGLSADTNSFINTNVTYKSFVNASKLVELGADINKINELQYKNRSKTEVRCKQFLWNSIKYDEDIAYCMVSTEDLTNLGAKKSDCDNFSSEILSIKGVNYSFSLVEMYNGAVNVSMRSKSGYDVQKIAFKLGGGGHICASGAVVFNQTMKDVCSRIINLIKNENNNK